MWLFHTYYTYVYGSGRGSNILICIYRNHSNTALIDLSFFTMSDTAHHIINSS